MQIMGAPVLCASKSKFFLYTQGTWRMIFKITELLFFSFKSTENFSIPEIVESSHCGQNEFKKKLEPFWIWLHVSDLRNAIKWDLRGDFFILWWISMTETRPHPKTNFPAENQYRARAGLTWSEGQQSRAFYTGRLAGDYYYHALARGVRRNCRRLQIRPQHCYIHPAAPWREKNTCDEKESTFRWWDKKKQRASGYRQNIE